MDIPGFVDKDLIPQYLELFKKTKLVWTEMKKLDKEKNLEKEKLEDLRQSVDYLRQRCFEILDYIRTKGSGEDDFEFEKMDSLLEKYQGDLTEMLDKIK